MTRTNHETNARAAATARTSAADAAEILAITTPGPITRETAIAAIAKHEANIEAAIAADAAFWAYRGR